MGLLGFGFGVGYMGGHGAFALASVPGVEDFVAEFAAFGGALFCCHCRWCFVYYMERGKGTFIVMCGL